MKTIGKAIIFSVLVLVLASCSSFSPNQTETSIPPETRLPTSASTPDLPNTPTPTLIPPTETSSAPVLQMPSGKPSSEWEGIPIMPNAIAGEGDSKGYSFTINASPDEIQKFYEQALDKLGWTLLASGKGSTNAIILIFTKDTGTASVSIIPQPDGVMYVMLVK